jgi:amino acid adenylation domain-containing protein
MLVNEFLERSADSYPDKVALIHEDRRLTYREVENKANSLSHALTQQGLSRGERAAVYLETSVETPIAIFGILKAGGVFLVINPQVKPDKVEYILNDCQVKCLITDSRHLQSIASNLPDCPNLETIIVVDKEYKKYKLDSLNRFKFLDFSDITANFSTDRPPKKCIDIDLASLIYTSGSTGIPKGVTLTHLNMVSAASSIIEYLENQHDDIIIDVLPLSFDYGLYQVLMAFKFGGTVVLERSFLYPYKLIDLIIKEKVTGFPLVPTIAAILLKLKNLEKFDFRHVRYISNTAQAFPPEHIFKLQKIFPNARIYSMYGLTECKRVSYLPPAELERRPTSVGIAMPNTQVFIVDEKGQKIEEHGRAGELVVRGANVMKGYWNLPQETAQVLKPGPIPGEMMLYTGDLFRKDEEGFLYFISRKDDLIKTGGERVSPKEIENVLHQIDGISEAAVVGVSDEILGQAIKAFVTLKDEVGLTEKDIIKLSSLKLESFMVPKYIEIMEELPKSSHGKVDKKKLKAMLQERKNGVS